MDGKIRDLAKNTVVPTASKNLTTDFGCFVSDTDNWLKAADSATDSAADSEGRGPSLLEDQIAREKIHRFDHERIPERVVHARGAAAHGYFKVTDSAIASKYTFAPVLTDTSRKTPVFLRFSTVQGARGSADTVRDVRGFAVKFYTHEGNWDLVGNNIPVFFIQDAIKFPDFVHAVKPEPHNDVPQGQTAHNNFWDFVGLQPEATHMVMWAMSDRAIPRSYRMMQGFGVNTYTLINAKGEVHFVKFHFIPELGVNSFVWDEALKICGQDPDFHRKDLEEAINAGYHPRWKLAIQVIPKDRENNFEFDILDATKIWPEPEKENPPEKSIPLQIIGELVLNRTVDEFFPETEQAAFCTGHVVPGIGFSDDPLLQGRNFSYFDTQITRLGVNWEQIPINRPICPVHVLNHHRDGQHQMRIVKSKVNYWPNRYRITGPVPPNEGGYAEHPHQLSNVTKKRTRGKKFQEHYSQAELFYNSLTEYERNHLIDAFSFELSHCDDPTVPETYIKVLKEVNFKLAEEVAKRVGATPPEKPTRPSHGNTSSPLSQTYYTPKEPTIVTRRVAILVADGFEITEVKNLSYALKSAGAFPFIIGPRRGIVKSASGAEIRADHHFEGQRSTLFDALFIPSGGHTNELGNNGRVIHWIKEAFGHLKVIGAVGTASVFVKKALQIESGKLEFATDKDDTPTFKVVNSYCVVTVKKYPESLQENLQENVEEKPEEKPESFAKVFIGEIAKHRCYPRETDGLTKEVAY